MIPRLAGAILAATVVTLAANPAAAFGPAPGAEPGLLCRQAIRQAEAGSGLPQHMLTGIARVESGRRDPGTGRLHPWPWTINAEGRGYYFESKAEAITFAKGLQARGVRSFDAGCLQVNLMHHASAFQSLEEAFDPVTNARYAVKFLTQLREKTGSWETASAWYHSANPELGGPYRTQVVAAMADEATGASAYAALAPITPGAGSAPAPIMAMPPRALPPGPGAIMFLAGAPSGMILPRPNASPGGFAGGGMPGAGAMGAGRGLDSYRMQPVQMLAPRLIASR